MNDNFYIKHQNHLKLNVLLKDKINFENAMTLKNLPFYSKVKEQAFLDGGINYFILETDRQKVGSLLIENNIVASTETIPNQDFRDIKKFYKVYAWVAISIVVLIVLALIIEFIVFNY
ncbi:hypothetical protein [Aequorivita sediminis]|uniref:hypothetical protein n=1 Tax=Aequorivita sediminis TaxID=3073653 RepID=UPI0028B09B25|nr:hypothetical protein [Aequorivita sp. F6058]